MKKELRILILEDVPTDVELMEHELRKRGIIFTSRHVDKKESFLKELLDFMPDLILADYSIPNFDGISALEIVKEKCPDVPFILVSGAIGEELAIEILKKGATDYVLKSRLSRLVPSVIRVLKEAEEHAERKKTEEELWESQERYRALVDNTMLGIAVMDTNYRIIMVNSTFAKLFKKSASDFAGKYCFREFEKREAVCQHCPGTRAMVSGKTEEVETQGGVRDDGTSYYVHNRAAPFFGSDGMLKGFIEMVEDITERKQAEEERVKLQEDLQKRVKELGEFYDMAVGRELKMIELKKEIEGLKEELEKYKKQ